MSLKRLSRVKASADTISLIVNVTEDVEPHDVLVALHDGSESNRVSVVASHQRRDVSKKETVFSFCFPHKNVSDLLFFSVVAKSLLETDDMVSFAVNQIDGYF